jgi:protein ImuA
MGIVFPFEHGGAPDRAALLRARVEPLVSLERRFARTVSVSDEIDSVLPFHGLPLGCVHELQSRGLACGIAFASLLAARIPAPRGRMVYVAPDSSFHPLGLLSYGVPPKRWIHVATRNSLDLAWTVLEALRCPQVSAVLAVVKSADLTLCRRFQLAAEGSGATGFLLTDATSKPGPSVASVITRWQISSIMAPPESAFGEPCWKIELSYCRGGRPGLWRAVWRNGLLKPLEPSSEIVTSKPAQRVSVVPANALAG